MRLRPRPLGRGLVARTRATPFGIGALERDRTVLTATVPGLVFGTAFFGTVAVLVGRDGRERRAGLLSPLPLLAVGLLAIRLLPPGWALLVIVAAMSVVAGSFVAWHKRRTPARRKPQTVTVPLVPVKPLEAPVAGHCRWCGQRPVAVVCGGRSDGGPCETAEAAASDLGGTR